MDIGVWLRKLKPTWYSAFPIFHDSIFESIRHVPDKRALHCLRFVLSSGTPLKPELQQGLANALGVPVLEFYGIGEAGHMSANVPPPGRCKIGTCGMPLPGEMIIAEGEHALPAGQLGEVLVRGPTAVAGYLDDAHANQEYFVDGWFRTGDLGAFDADGFVSIHGRVKELINRGGEKIAPVEVERALLRHRSVTEAAVFAIPHPRLHQDVAAAVVLDRAASATAEELKAFVRKQVAPFKVPRFVAVMAELPKDITGKVRRRELATTVKDLLKPTDPDSQDPFEHSPLTADLLALWRALLACECISVDDDFFTLGGDSLNAVQMRLAIEQLIGRALPATILLEAPTIRQLARAITQYDCPDTSVVRVVGPKNQAPPFFFFHGDFTSGGYYVRRLADLVADAATLISVAPHGLGCEPLPASIQEMATDRLREILALQPTGPFRLGGHCNGGTVAFEVARLLQAQGHRVELLALIDVPAVNAGSPMRLLRYVTAAVLALFCRDDCKREDLVGACMTRAWLLYERTHRLWRMTHAQRRAKLRQKIKLQGRLLRRRLSRRALYLRSPGIVGHSPQNDPMNKIRHYFKALAQYFPESLDVPIVYYSAEHSGHFMRRVSSQVEIKNLRTDHFSCITTNLHLIAEHLRERLNLRLADPATHNCNVRYGISAGFGSNGTAENPLPAARA